MGFNLYFYTESCISLIKLIITTYFLLELGGTNFEFSLQPAELMEYLTQITGRVEVKVEREQVLEQEEVLHRNPFL